MKRVLGLAIGLASLLGVASAAAPPPPFRLTSSAFGDGGMLATRNAADDPMRMCGGQNISPPLAWSDPPAGTKSFAILMFDPDGQLGVGVSHWLAYGIAANVTSLAEGETSKPGPKFVGGLGTRGSAVYLGPCPPMGDAPHHYIFTVVALDLATDALKPGLTRDQLYAAMAGHALGGASIVGKYAR